MTHFGDEFKVIILIVVVGFLILLLFFVSNEISKDFEESCDSFGGEFVIGNSGERCIKNGEVYNFYKLKDGGYKIAR